MKNKTKKKIVVKKPTSYQKLKVEILALKQDIYNLVNGEFLPKLQTESKWKSKFDVEKFIMSGSRNNVGNGITDKIKKVKKKK